MTLEDSARTIRSIGWKITKGAFALFLCLWLGTCAWVILTSDAKAEPVTFKWQQPGDPALGQVDAAEVTWAILYVGRAPFVAGALDAINGDLAALVIETPEPEDGVVIGVTSYDGVYTHELDTADPLPPSTVYKTLRSGIGASGRKATSNTLEVPIPEPPVLLSQVVALGAVFAVRRRRRG